MIGFGNQYNNSLMYLAVQDFHPVLSRQGIQVKSQFQFTDKIDWFTQA